MAAAVHQKTRFIVTFDRITTREEAEHWRGVVLSAPRIEDAAFTLEYAAPEQILGELPSTATDVYQMGVLIFALLTGRLPLGQEGTTRAQRIKAALDADPPRLSEAAPAELRKALRGDLDAIVSKALRKLPRERYGVRAQPRPQLR